MPKHGKRYAQAKVAMEARDHSINEAVAALRSAAYAKFDETLEVAVNLDVDPRHADQMVRSSVVLPHGTGKTKRILVFAQGEKVKEAEEAGADHVGGKDLVDKITGGWLEFDAVISTPDMMREVGKLGRVLGPRGLMPNPKTGTVTFDVGKAVDEIRAASSTFESTRTVLSMPRWGAFPSTSSSWWTTSERCSRRLCVPSRQLPKVSTSRACT